MLKLGVTSVLVTLLSLTTVITALSWYYHYPRLSDIKKKKKKSKITIEVCLSDIQSLQQVILEGHCNSVELCTNRLEGGVTASIGLIRQCVIKLRNSYHHINTSIDLHVLIRPRPGGFTYNDDEFEIIQNDILNAKLAGVHGIVFGAIDRNGRIDIERMKVVRRLSEGMILTFHRAFDMLNHTDENHTDDLESLLDIVISLGCDRLLTSGGKVYAQPTIEASVSSLPYSIEGLKRLVKHANNRILVIAASGITSNNVQEIIQQTHVEAVHVGKAVTEEIDENSAHSVSAGIATALDRIQNNVEMIKWYCVTQSKLTALVQQAYIGWKHIAVSTSQQDTNVSNVGECEQVAYSDIITLDNDDLVDRKSYCSPGVIHHSEVEEESMTSFGYVYISNSSNNIYNSNNNVYNSNINSISNSNQ